MVKFEVLKPNPPVNEVFLKSVCLSVCVCRPSVFCNVSDVCLVYRYDNVVLRYASQPALFFQWTIAVMVMVGD